MRAHLLELGDGLRNPPANHLTPQGVAHERRQPKLGALHRALRTGWPHINALAQESPAVSTPDFVDKPMKANLAYGQFAPQRTGCAGHGARSG